MENQKEIFGKKNYQIMFVGLAFIISGFILMSGGDTGDETSFNPEIFNFHIITLAPILIITGFVIVDFAIMNKEKK